MTLVRHQPRQQKEKLRPVTSPLGVHDYEKTESLYSQRAREAQGTSSKSLTMSTGTAWSFTSNSSTERTTPRPPLTHTSWFHALSYSASQMASLSNAEKTILSNDRHRNDFDKFALTLATLSEPIEVQQAYHRPTPHRNLQSYRYRRDFSARTLRSSLLEVRSVEDLASSPLSDFITLAVN